MTNMKLRIIMSLARAYGLGFGELSMLIRITTRKQGRAL